MYVSDTHPLVWYLTGKLSFLSPKVLNAFKSADAGNSLINISSVVLWEAAILQRKGRFNLGESFDRWVDKLSSKDGFNIVQLEPGIISRSVGYSFNNDIFDKAIVATAGEMDLPLITKDSAITESNLVEVYW